MRANGRVQLYGTKMLCGIANLTIAFWAHPAYFTACLLVLEIFFFLFWWAFRQVCFALGKSYLFLSVSPVLLFQALCFSKLCITQLCIGTLTCPQVGQLFFFHDFQQSLLNCFPNQHFQDRLDFNVKVKQLRMGVRETEINDLWSQSLLASWQGEKEDEQSPCAEDRPEKCRWGPSVSQSKKCECRWGISDERAGVRHHTPHHSCCRGCQGGAEHSPGPYFCSPLDSQPLLGLDPISTGESISSTL